MMDSISESIRLDAILENYGDDELNALYKDVFSTDKGMLVLQDIANRCFVYAPAISTDPKQADGMRSVFLSIQTRIKNAVAKRKDGT